METFDHLRLPIETLSHATKNFNVKNFIAEGGFGQVFKAVFENTVGAVKLFNRSKEKADVSFMTEVMFLTSCSHENLISLLGFCDEGENRILVYEYACNKSLDFHITSPALRWTQRLKICVGVACGLQYLHDPKGTLQRIIHRDIKSGNILLDENWNAKIADFGLSRYGPANQKRTFVFSEAKGTLGYCDPMYVVDMLLTKESDVYSFGVVLFEVLCSRLCVDLTYSDERRSLPILVKKRHQEQRLHTIIDVNLRQQIDDDCFNTFVTLALQCLERERKRRPTMETVVSKLKIALQFQENFEIKEAERRNRFSQKEVVLNLKSQEKFDHDHLTVPLKEMLNVNKKIEVKEAKRKNKISHKQVEVACGLHYLHDPKGTQQNIIHRDIKSGSILLDKNWNAKIADFNLSRHSLANQKRTFVSTEAKGTLGYCDHMLLRKESDVYSFGIVLFEVLCSMHHVDLSYNDERRSSLILLVKECHQEQRLQIHRNFKSAIILLDLGLHAKIAAFGLFILVYPYIYCHVLYLCSLIKLA